MLRVDNVTAQYGRTPALHGISLKVNKGELVTLIGANGAGKSTTLRTISGLLPASGGRIIFEGKDITTARASTIVRAGLTHSPEGRRVFPMMSVYENLQVGAHVLDTTARVRAGIDNVFTYFPRLAERRYQLAGHLSGGEQQMLAIGRALMPNPKLLLLDEPSLGLAPLLVRQVFQIVKQLSGAGLSLLLVEQNAQLALSLADRAYVLEGGRVVLTGAGRDLLNHADVVKAYLGSSGASG